MSASAERDWRQTSLRYGVRRFAGGSTPSADAANWTEPPDGTPFVSIGDMSNVREVAHTARSVTTMGRLEAGLTVRPPGTVLYSMYASLGLASRAAAPLVHNQAILAIYPDPNIVDADFLLYWLDHMRPRVTVEARSNTQANLSADVVSRLPLTLPPLEVQRRIVNYLDTETARIDTLVTKNEHAATLIEERLWAVVEERVLPSEGKTTRLGTLALSMIDGPFGSNLASKHYVDDGPRVVRLANVGRAQFLDADVACITPEHFAELHGHSVIPGDLVVAGLGDNSSDAPAGRACVVPDELGPAIVKADCHRVRLPAGCSARYFAWQLSSLGSLAEASALARGSTRSRLNLTLNGQRTVLVPSVGKQQQIAADLDRLRDQTAELLDHLQYQLNLLRERRRALITAAVTGEFEI